MFLCPVAEQLQNNKNKTQRLILDFNWLDITTSHDMESADT